MLARSLDWAKQRRRNAVAKCHLRLALQSFLPRGVILDTDGDGLEDKAELFWDGSGKLRGPIGLAVTPPGYKHGQGVFVPSKGRLSLILDKNGDDRADEEIIVATGWQEIPQNVDAVGCAVGSDGSIYFSLGARLEQQP